MMRMSRSRSQSRSYGRKISPAMDSPRDGNYSRGIALRNSRSDSREPSKSHEYRSKGRRRSRSRSRSSRRYRSRSRSYSPSSRRRDRRSPRRQPASRENPPKNRCLGIFGLSIDTNQQQIINIFGKFGPIERVQVVVDAKTGRSRGFCFVYFERIEDAKVAKDNCSGMDIDGRIIRVDYSTTLRPHSPTPGVYMGKAKRSYRNGGGGGGGSGGGGGGDDDYYHERRSRRSPSPYYRERRRRYDRSRSRSYSPRDRRYR